MEEDEYELVPLSPVRRLEKRMDTMEKSSASQQMLKEVLDIIKSNQEIVEDIVKVNSEMISRVSELAGDVNMLMEKVNDFITRIEVVAGEEEKKEEPAEGAAKLADVEKKLDEKLTKLEKRVNALVISSLSKQRLLAQPRRQLA